MHFVLYPQHEFDCPHVKCCAHLGGASLGSLVHAADKQTDVVLKHNLRGRRGAVSGGDAL